MESKTIVTYLRELQAELEPFTKSSSLGARVWDGSEYVKTESRPVDAFVLSWATALRVAADLIEAPDGPISDGQIEYIERMFCGGMGSFADYQIDTKTWGQKAKTANENIDRIRAKLHQTIQMLK